MPLRLFRLAAGLVIIALSVAAEETDNSTRAKGAVRAHLRESIMARLPAKSADSQTPVAPVEPPADDAVKLAPFIVKELRYPTNAAVDAGMQKEKALESHALYKTDLSKKLRMEVGLPPTEGSHGGFSLPLLRLSW